MRFRPVAPRLVPALVLVVLAVSAARAQPATSRSWRPEERLLLPDLSRVTAVAATQLVVYAATRDALAVYDRGSLALRDVVGVVDGYPAGAVTAMVADPNDDTAWLGGAGVWVLFEPVGRRITAGALPGAADQVVLDQADPSRGAYFHTAAGWFFVPRIGFAAQRATDVPPPSRWIAGLSPQQLLARAPAFDLVRQRIERDALLRTWPMTSAAMTPARNEVFVGTDGNGAYRVDLDTYAAERLPAGLLASPTGAVTADRDEICAGAEPRFRTLRRGVTCFRIELSDFRYYEGTSLAVLPGTIVRRLLVSSRAIWVAGDQGLLRLDRASGEMLRLGEREGLPSEDVRTLLETPAGIWVGTSRGLAVVPDTGRTVRAAASLVLDAAVLSLAARADTIWIGTASGLFVLPPGARAPAPAAPGHPELIAPIVALAVRGDTLLAALPSRLAWRAGSDEWRVLAPPGTSVGELAALAAGRDGFWVAGTAGLAFFQPARGVWRALTAPGDVPQPVLDVAAGGDWVWAATPAGVVRLDRRVLGR